MHFFGTKQRNVSLKTTNNSKFTFPGKSSLKFVVSVFFSHFKRKRGETMPTPNPINPFKSLTQITFIKNARLEAK